jgi:hypothetical protein
MRTLVANSAMHEPTRGDIVAGEEWLSRETLK